MSEEKSLSARKLAVIEDLFEGKHQRQILNKHKLSRKLFNRWLADERFSRRLDSRIEWEYRKNEFKLARSAGRALTNLLKLTKSDKDETARKACVDIIKIGADHSSGSSATQLDNPAPDRQSQTLTPETAGKLLAVLAQEKKA